MKTMEPTPRPAVGADASESAESDIEELWDRGERPDVRAFLSTRGTAEIAIDNLLGVLRVDQRRRW